MTGRQFSHRFRLAASGVALLVATLVGCGEDAAPSIAIGLQPVTPVADLGVTARSALARARLEVGRRALERPTRVDLPHAEWGGFRANAPSARGIAFAGGDGQVLEITLARPGPAAAPPGAPIDLQPRGAAIDLQLFLVEPRTAQSLPLAALPAGELSLHVRLPETATYVIRLQPAAMAGAQYYLTLELGPALPFPVRGYTVGSYYGASRDAGRRHHEGVDIFAPRRTPVLAVADGRASYRVSNLGGHSIWLNTPGVSYYYAHLERVAVGGGERVRAGDIVGYVGDSGNAASVGPHLHFGIYKWGSEPVDPLPLLEERRFAGPPEAAFETEKTGRPAPKCSARFPDSISTQRTCLAFERADVAPPPTLIAAATLPVELAPTSAVLTIDSASDASTLTCSSATSGLPGVCIPRARRVMTF